MEGLVNHLGDEASKYGRGCIKAGVGVDFDDPGAEVLVDEEVEAEELEVMWPSLFIKLVLLREYRVYNQIVDPWNYMVPDPEIKLRVLLPEVVLNSLVTERVPVFVDTVAIAVYLKAVVGEVDVVVHVF